MLGAHEQYFLFFNFHFYQSIFHQISLKHIYKEIKLSVS